MTFVIYIYLKGDRQGCVVPIVPGVKESGTERNRHNKVYSLIEFKTD